MNARLGIIGGGQLGLYLCEAAQALGMQVCILAEAADAVALQRADRAIVGDLDSALALDQLLAASDVIAFDKEAVPDAALHYLIEVHSRAGVAIFPRAETLLMLKDKALQKDWLQRHALPTLPFHTVSGKAGLGELPVAMLGTAVVQKARCGGYDGRGVQILPALAAAQLWDVPSIVEPYLPDCGEIAVIAVRDQAGAVRMYPPVAMEFDPQLNSVRTVSMPAAISPALGAAALALAERTVTLMGGVGVFAVEMFITPGDELLINEISPRVHNSGHITLDACNVSQFEQHVRAVAGLPLVIIVTGPPAAMVNILFSEGLRENCPDKPLAVKLADPHTSVYWYGKPPGKAGRKMGHINAVAGSAALALALAHKTMVRLSAHGNIGQAA